MIRRPPRSTLSLHDALPICRVLVSPELREAVGLTKEVVLLGMGNHFERSEEHTSELQSQSNLVCRLLLEKKRKRVIPLVSSSRWRLSLGIVFYVTTTRACRH